MLSPEMALRIEKAFDVSMDMLLRMQAWYDASQMHAQANEVRVRRYVPAGPETAFLGYTHETEKIVR